MSVRGIAVRCEGCPAQLSDPEFDPEGRTVGEKGDWLLKLAKRDGWAVRIERGEGIFTCPACTATRAAQQTGPLPPFDPRARCPKCGFNRVATRFCAGRTIDCLIRVLREHLHRRCGRCGYDWIQATKDHQQEKPSGQ